MDWNNDGRHDLLAGDSEGKVKVYLNINTNTHPILYRGKYVQAAGVDIDVGERATPVSVDWNGDGKKDLIIGNMKGSISIYINTGEDSAPLFDSPYLLEVRGKDFDIGSRAAPRVYDWNHDGLKDLLVGEAGGYVYYLKNVGTNSAPVFERAEKLFLVNGDILRYPSPSGSARSRLFVTDWNNDGLDDILLGGSDGKIILFEAASETPFSVRDFIKKTWIKFRESAVKLKRRLQ